MKKESLKEKTYEELRKLASKKKIEGRSKMNKKELVKAILKKTSIKRKIMKGGSMPFTSDIVEKIISGEIRPKYIIYDGEKEEILNIEFNDGFFIFETSDTTIYFPNEFFYLEDDGITVSIKNPNVNSNNEFFKAIRRQNEMTNERKKRVIDENFQFLQSCLELMKTIDKINTLSYEEKFTKLQNDSKGKYIYFEGYGNNAHSSMSNFRARLNYLEMIINRWNELRELASSNSRLLNNLYSDIYSQIGQQTGCVNNRVESLREYLYSENPLFSTIEELRLVAQAAPSNSANSVSIKSLNSENINRIAKNRILQVLRKNLGNLRNINKNKAIKILGTFIPDVLRYLKNKNGITRNNLTRDLFLQTVRELLTEEEFLILLPHIETMLRDIVIIFNETGRLNSNFNYNSI